MQRYTTQLSISGRRSKMETTSEKRTSDNETPETKEPNQKENCPDDTPSHREVLVTVNNEKKTWPLEKDDEKKYLEQFKEVSEEDKQKYLDFFKTADIDNVGYLSSRQFYFGLHDYGIYLPVHCISTIFTDLNVNRDLILTVDEFMTGMCKKDSRKYTEDDWWKLFNKFDKNNSGFFTQEDVKRELDAHKVKYNEFRLKDMIREADKDCDGRIDYREFRAAWKKHYTYK